MRIVERTPVGVIRSDAGYTLVDAAGVALSTTSDQPAGQPVIDVPGGVDSAAFRSAGLVVRSLPADIRAALTGISARTADDVTLTLNSGLSVVWGSAEESALKAVVLSKAMASNPEAASIDVTSPKLPSSADPFLGEWGDTPVSSRERGRAALTFDQRERNTGKYFTPLLEV